MKNFIVKITCILIYLSFNNAFSQSLELVRDIALDISQSSNPSDFINVNGTFFFTANSEGIGRELYKTDRTTNGTVLVKDIYPGSESSYVGGLTNINGTLFFAARDKVGWTDLWKSDGTEQGTVLVKDIYNDFGSSPSFLTNFNGTLFFVAGDPTHGAELWRSDGTEAGTFMVKDIRNGSNSTHPAPRNLIIYNNSLFFIAYHDSYGYELWKSDGTEEGTVLVKDINSGTASGFAENQTDNFTISNGLLFFTATNGINGTELWKTDGTASGTVMVKDINPGSANGMTPAIDHMTSFNGYLYFHANDNVHGQELWRTNGTSVGTEMLKDISPGGSDSYPRDFTVVNNLLFFKAVNWSEGKGYELWKSDGTAAGTNMVKDIFVSNTNTLNPPRKLTNLNGTLIFVATDGINGLELWKSDGTEAGTVMVKSINSGLADAFDSDYSTFIQYIPFYTFGNIALFSANNGSNGFEFWETNGTEAGTKLVKNINFLSSNPQNLTNVNGTLFFTANNGLNGNELWKSNGTETGTAMVKDMNIGSNSTSNFDFFTSVNDMLFFVADDHSLAGRELWRSDGTEAGTFLTKDICSGCSTNYPNFLTALGSQVYFRAFTPTIGYDLYKSDGTENGTDIVKDFKPDRDPNASWNFVINVTYPQTLNDKLYFFANGGFWRSDGTEAGTTLVKDEVGGWELTKVGNLLYWATGNNQIWRSDGTEAGTYLVKEIPSAFSWDTSNLTDVDGTLFFVSNNGLEGGTGAGVELWKSNGTEAGTILVKNINVGGNSYPHNLTNVNGMLYFFADDGIHGNEPWKSNGTEQGTVLIKDILVGAESSVSQSNNPSVSKNFRGTFYFAANNGTNGTELWKSNGTLETTTMVSDIYFGGSSSSPMSFVSTSENLYFSANDGVFGRELWKYTPPPCAILQTLISPTDNITIGTALTQASAINGKIQASNHITGTAKVTYQAKSIELNPSFRAENGTVFKAEVGGCN